jgi:DNA-binding transcriptional ArsR family regulator
MHPEIKPDASVDASIYHQMMIFDGNEAPVALAKALADPLRLRVMEILVDGPAAVTELVAATGASQPSISNHLAILRRRGAVQRERRGRQILYRVTDDSVARLLEAMLALGASHRRPPRDSPLARARTCYDHLAGSFGVALLDALVEARAVRSPADDEGDIELGPNGPQVFDALGVDVAGAIKARRRFAFACPDWTERRPHLGGALGAAVCARFVLSGWIQKDAGSRAVHVTTKGTRALRRLLDLRPTPSPRMRSQRAG